MTPHDKLPIEIVEVGPRDGYQGIGPFIPTETKIRLLEHLAAAGLKRIEIGSFVSTSALPQMRDTPEVLAAANRIPGLTSQVLVPSERRGREAVAAGAGQLVFVLSVSEAHNRNNVRRHPLELVAEYGRLLAAISPESRSGSISRRPSTVRSTVRCRKRKPWLCLTAWCRFVRTPRSACATPRGGSPRTMWKGCSKPACRASFRLAPGRSTVMTPTAWVLPTSRRPSAREYACSMHRSAGWAAVRSLPELPAMSRPRMSCGCSSAWESPQASISTPWFRSPARLRHYPAPLLAGGSARRCWPARSVVRP